MIRALAALMLLVALQLVPSVGMADASATVFFVANREIAWANCRADAATRSPNGAHLPKCTANYTKNPGAGHDRVASCLTNSPYTETSSCWVNPYNEWDWPTANGGCPAGTTWNDITKTCHSPEKCLAKPSVPIGIINVDVSGMTMCSGGCQFQAQTGTSSSLTINGTQELNSYYGGAYKPTGNACSAGENGPPPNDPQLCVPVDGQTMCKKADGKLCASASTGRQICWNPNETGEKTDGSFLQVRSAGSTAPTPATPPPPGESFSPSGSTIHATESVGGGSSITTNITNYTTVNGTAASGSGQAPSDQGETGDGTGSPDSHSDYGSAGAGLGTIYEKGDSTLDSAFSDFSAQVQAAPIVAATTGFFTFNDTAACPIWTVPETAYWAPMTADWLCTGALADVLPLAGYLCLAVAAWLAFKIAVVW